MTLECIKAALAFCDTWDEVNFTITTNIAEGHGLNGVSYQTYQEKKETYSFLNGRQDKLVGYEYTTVYEIGDTYLVLDVERKDKEWNSGHFRVFLPFENIVEIKVQY